MRPLRKHNAPSKAHERRCSAQNGAGIESIEEAQSEDRNRLFGCLVPRQHQVEEREKGSILELAVHLAEACDGNPNIRTLASKMAFRRLRIPWVRHVESLVSVSDGTPLSFATLLPRSLELAENDLASFDPEAAKNALRSYLVRRGIDQCKGWLIAGLHGEYDSIGKVWRVHWHILASDEVIPLIDALRSEDEFKSCRGETPRVRMSREPLTDIPRLASYLLQSWWPNRPKGKFGDSLHETRTSFRSRLPMEQEAAWLLWMHQRKLSDLVLLIGLRRTTSGFRITEH